MRDITLGDLARGLEALPRDRGYEAFVVHMTAFADLAQHLDPRRVAPGVVTDIFFAAVGAKMDGGGEGAWYRVWFCVDPEDASGTAWVTRTTGNVAALTAGIVAAASDVILNESRWRIRQLEWAEGGPFLGGILVKPNLTTDPDAAHRIHIMRFGAPEHGPKREWTAYSGGLVRWLKETLLPKHALDVLDAQYRQQATQTTHTEVVVGPQERQLTMCGRAISGGNCLCYNGEHCNCPCHKEGASYEDYESYERVLDAFLRVAPHMNATQLLRAQRALPLVAALWHGDAHGWYRADAFSQSQWLVQVTPGGHSDPQWRARQMVTTPHTCSFHDTAEAARAWCDQSLRDAKFVLA